MTSGKHIFVIADDLTGAADAANYFRTATHSVRVSFHSDAPWIRSLDANVVQVFDSESRALTVNQASRRVARAGVQLKESFDKEFLVYKKIDSTIRGHIGAEIEALLRGLGLRIAVLVPSFPANGRTVREGRLLVNGVPISQTPFARDPRNPVVRNRVSDIVSQTSRLPIFELNYREMMNGPQAITQYLGSLSQQEGVVIIDAQSDADLANIAQAISEQPWILPCGSAGLAKHLASIWVDSAEKMPASIPGARAPVCNQVLIAVGSANPISHLQLRHAADRFGSQIVEMRPSRLAKGHTYTNEMHHAQERLANDVDECALFVCLAEERAQRDPDLPGSFESDMATVITQWSEPLLHNQHRNIGYVITGGDTALALCQEMDTNAIWPEGEVVSGMPWSWVETVHGKFPMVSKAGGFGDEDALQQAARFLLGPNMLH